MKKILVLSDSHSYFDKVLKIFEKEKPDIVIGAGDGIKDIEELSYIYPKAEYYMVKGNCDYFDRSHNEENLFEIDNIKIFLTHGHLYGVKRTLSSIKEIGKKLNVSLIVFGHTHKPYIEKDGDITLFNPGATEDGRYGIIILEKGNIELIHKQL
ncbi:metallophosphoesterase [Fusobacterium sp. oral taxon 203]|uniref:metallophosphoesterase n=1 Tax=Fusobacterium sp. oral taxon 203 TaxID=671211 RepID=UPI000B92C852|nr:metallophosphoesterase [Fusobacterium sp. oral taxon 203]ASS39347.1 YfcE family phosphodiesterase [Fusobacterium sp. oral taxon 203]